MKKYNCLNLQMRICLIEQLHWQSTWFWDKIVLNAFFLFQLFQITNNFDLLVTFQFEFCWMVTSAPFSIISNCAQFWWQEEVVTELLFQLFQYELNWAAWWLSSCFNYFNLSRITTISGPPPLAPAGLIPPLTLQQAYNTQFWGRKRNKKEK